MAAPQILFDESAALTALQQFITYAVRHLGACVPPEAIDVPYLSAVVTVRRLRDLERRYGKRTAEARAKAWRVGVGR